jgi:hypothetical protein
LGKIFKMKIEAQGIKWPLDMHGSRLSRGCLCLWAWAIGVWARLTF